MSKKYVPSFLKGSMTNSFAALDDSKEDICKKEEAKPLVNTSLPAKQAPVLAPATLASLTSNGAPPRPFSFSPPGLEIKPILKQESIKKKPLEAADFPALGSKKPTSIALVQKTSFSELSREWAKKQKEEEAMLKEEKEKEASAQRLMNKQRMDEETARKMGIIHVPTHLLRAKKLDPEEEAMRKRELEEDYNSDDDESLFESVRAEYVEEEEEEEYECDGTWNQRKHRDELY